jgi:hypothetical protein
MFSESSYDAMLHGEATVNAAGINVRNSVSIAKALQKAALRIRDDEETEAPYYWARSVTCAPWKLPVQMIKSWIAVDHVYAGFVAFLG